MTDPYRVTQLRNQDGLSVALVIYVDLPDAEAEHWLEHYETNLVLDRKLSLALVALLDAEDSGEAQGLDNDEASRALSLFVGLGPDRQAWLVDVIEGAINTKPEPGKPDALAGENVERTWHRDIRRFGIEAAEEARKAREAVQRGADAVLDAGAVVEAATRITKGEGQW